MLTAVKTARAVSLSALKCLSFPHPVYSYEKVSRPKGFAIA
ncbi:hypothetical protein [Nostoc sp.]